MTCHKQCARLWLSLAIVPVLLGLLMASFARAAAAEALVTTDYLVSHTSSEPSYAQYRLDPRVVLHMREVVLAGRERTVAGDGKVVLLLHGATVPGSVAFDLDHEQSSLLRYLAWAGWDAFALDFEGYGMSTRPLPMDAPAAFPDSRAPIDSEAAVHDVERAVEFIRALRGVDRVSLLGWSLAASRESPQFDAAKITVPTLVIRGALDTWSTQQDSRLLIAELGSEIKSYVEIPDASHFLQYERGSLQFFKAVKDFLESKVD